MSDNNSLNEKYGKYEEEAPELEAQEAPQKPKKEKKVKEKKVKEPKEKAPKEKKPKKEKAPKEKKVKEPKPPKAEKPKKEKIKKEKRDLKAKKDRDDVLLPSEEIIEETAKTQTEEIAQETVETRHIEEFTFGKVDVSKYLQSEEPEKAEETKKENIEEIETSNEDIEEIEAPLEEAATSTEVAENEENSEQLVNQAEENVSNEEPLEEPKKKKSKKEKKVKEPKEKKPKKEKAPKEKKPKKEKKVKEKKPKEPLTKKDVVTIVIAVIAFWLALCLGAVMFFTTRTEDQKYDLVKKYSVLGKVFPEYVAKPNNSNENDDTSKLAGIQVTRDGLLVNLVQSDIPNIFYGFNSDYSVQYYQYRDKEIVPVKYTDSIDLKVDMGSGILNIKMNYIKVGEYICGVSAFTADNSKDLKYYYDLVVFKLTALPSKYNSEGHALLLASTDKNALLSNDILWSESFNVNLSSGEMTRFLSVTNRTIDEKGAGVTDFCMLPKAGYTSTLQGVPFISSREYPTGSSMQDIFVKNGSSEKVLAEAVYGKFFIADSASVVYFRKTTTGFDAVRNINGEEKNIGSFYGNMTSNYMISGKYLLSKGDGKLYNFVSGKEYTLVGYSMNIDSFIVSSDEQYVIMMGTVKNAVDYQIHVFNLKTGEYEKYVDKNYAPHMNLCFIDNTTAIYTAVEPNQGYEYSVIDVSKAFEK